MFALKFGKAEDANEFKKHFEEAKEVMKAFMPSKFLLLARSGERSRLQYHLLSRRVVS